MFYKIAVQKLLIKIQFGAVFAALLIRSLKNYTKQVYIIVFNCLFDELLHVIIVLKGNYVLNSKILEQGYLISNWTNNATENSQIFILNIFKWFKQLNGFVYQTPV